MGRSITLAAKANPGTGGGTEAQSSEDGGLGNSPHGSCLPRAVGSWEAGRGGELEVEERQNQQRQKALSEVGTECAVRWGRGAALWTGRKLQQGSCGLSSSRSLRATCSEGGKCRCLGCFLPSLATGK